MIYAVAKNHAFGLKSKIKMVFFNLIDTLPWHIPADFQFFKNTTQNYNQMEDNNNKKGVNACIMGLSTFKSIPNKGDSVLPGRFNIILDD